MADDRAPQILVYTRAFCGYCAAARRLLDAKNATYEETDVTMNAELRREIAERSGQSTLPQIFIDDQPIGGYDELSALEREGKLDALLSATD